MMWISPILEPIPHQLAIDVVDSVSTWLSTCTQPPDFGNKAAELGAAATPDPGQHAVNGRFA
jgi:hypothetical protein